MTSGGRCRSADPQDDGNAMLEFIALTALFFIPLTYLILAVFQVQGSAYGVTEAAREAGHAFVQADSLDAARVQSCAAAELALQDQSAMLSDCSTQLQITCVSDQACTPQLTPGATIRAHLSVAVPLPFLPSSIFGIPLTITVAATHDEIVDPYRAAR
jgi:Flp pilus assembly protein TadG